MSSYQVQGTVIKVLPLKEVSAKFSVREFVLEVVEGQYPQMLSFQCANAKTSLLDDVTVGSAATVHFNLRGRESNGRVWNSLDCFRLDVTRAAPEQTTNGDQW